SLAQAPDQILGGKIDDLDVVCLVENAIGDRFAHADPGDPGDDVVEALDVLNVEGCEDIDARGDQLLDVEIALGMPAAGVVGVSELVDDNQLRTPLEYCVQIHFREQMAFVLYLP